jgi:hypothetical protein
MYVGVTGVNTRTGLVSYLHNPRGDNPANPVATCSPMPRAE